MSDLIDKDKIKFDEIITEITNLKKYSNELASNTRGEKLENYINLLSKNVNNLENNIEKIYEENFDKTDTQ